MCLDFLVSVKMQGIQMISNHGLTLELNEFNEVKAPERRRFFCLLGSQLFLWCIWFVVGFLSLLFTQSQLQRAFPRN